MLKDYLETDMRNSHFNTGEMADKHTWNKKEIVCVVDDDTLMSDYEIEFQMLAKGSHRILMPATELPKRPKTGEVVYFDGTLFTVDEVSEELGLYIIYLSRGDR